MSDVQLPPEGVVVLAWWAADEIPTVMRQHGGAWERWDDEDCYFRAWAGLAPDHWITLSDARNAARYREALADIANGFMGADDAFLLARAALENRP